MSPLLLDIKRNALDDGPGIRSVVFFKGCPLRCDWCHNPEAMRPRAEIQRNTSCIACRACTRVCPEGVARPAASAEDRARCRVCGACVEACPAAARRVAGEAVEVGEVVARLLEDAPFYRRSGGGVTLSGGEPTLYASFAGAIAHDLRERGVHVLLETCGHFDWEGFEQHLLPELSQVYFDLKLADPEAHRRHCGVDNRRILENLARLAGRVPVLVRVPLVPGITDGADNLGALADLARGLGFGELALLPYNPLWPNKRRLLGLDLPYAHDRWMSAEELAACARVVEERGVRVAG